ncbi:MAG: hypothetical protein ABW032_09020 [Burkholderiaceae bacterium]
MRHQVIRIHADAPAKPSAAAPCNGCGVCCAAEPCPIGALISRRRTGACRALSWNADDARYVCGLAAAPRSVLPWLPRALAPPVRRLTLRWISAASGCDSSLAVVDA